MSYWSAGRGVGGLGFGGGLGFIYGGPFMNQESVLSDGEGLAGLREALGIARADETETKRTADLYRDLALRFLGYSSISVSIGAIISLNRPLPPDLSKFHSICFAAFIIFFLISAVLFILASAPRGWHKSHRTDYDELVADYWDFEDQRIAQEIVNIYDAIGRNEKIIVCQQRLFIAGLFFWVLSLSGIVGVRLLFFL